MMMQGVVSRIQCYHIVFQQLDVMTSEIGISVRI
jgi:hypothetical protein